MKIPTLLPTAQHTHSIKVQISLPTAQHTRYPNPFAYSTTHSIKSQSLCLQHNIHQSKSQSLCLLHKIHVCLIKIPIHLPTAQHIHNQNPNPFAYSTTHPLPTAQHICSIKILIHLHNVHTQSAQHTCMLNQNLNRFAYSTTYTFNQNPSPFAYSTAFTLNQNPNPFAYSTTCSIKIPIPSQHAQQKSQILYTTQNPNSIACSKNPNPFAYTTTYTHA